MDRSSKNPNPPTLIEEAPSAQTGPFVARFWRGLEESIWSVPEGKTRGFRLVIKRWLQILDRSLRGFLSHDGFSNASSLTYTTILTLVPLLAISVALLKGFGFHEMARDALLQMPISELRLEQPAPEQKIPITLTVGGEVRQTTVTLPANVSTTSTITASPAGPSPIEKSPPDAQPGIVQFSTVRDAINQVFVFVENTDVSNLGLIGAAGLLLAVLMMLSKIEDIMNDAWSVHRSRSVSRKLADYINLLLVIVLILVGLSAAVTQTVLAFKGVWSRVGLPGESAPGQRYLPYLVIWIIFCLAFTFIYYYLPNTRVRGRSAIISGGVIGTIFLLLQILLTLFPSVMGRYRVYGALAVVFVLLVWLYMSWVIVLWGAELCSAHQNLRDWRRRRRPWRGTPAERETLGLRMAALLATPLVLGGKARRLDTGDLADQLMLPPGPVGEMIELFQVSGLIVQTAEDGTYVLARDPNQLTVLDILRLVRQGRLEPAAPQASIMSELIAQMTHPLQKTTVTELSAMPIETIQTFVF